MRFASAAANSAAHEYQMRYRLFVEIGVTSGTIYACNGTEFLFALGNTYSPVAGFGGIEPLDEGADGSVRVLRAWLSAVGSSDFYEPLREDMFNRPFRVRHAFLDKIADTVVSSPELMWSGFVNKVEIRFADAERGNFYEIEAETALRRRAPASNFNIETHWTTLNQSGDTFFQFIDQVPLFRAMWGQQPTYFSGATGAQPGGGTTLPDYMQNPNWYIRFGGG
jgi:hypothetical protein